MYYVGLLAGKNDYHAMEASGEGRAVNRKNYSEDEVHQEIERPVVQRLMKLIRFRNDHPAFGGDLVSIISGEQNLVLRWENGTASAELTMDLDKMKCSVTHFTHGGKSVIYQI